MQRINCAEFNRFLFNMFKFWELKLLSIFFARMLKKIIEKIAEIEKNHENPKNCHIGLIFSWF